ncbi:hypothetical protein, partial [Staphylococcus aureus]
HMYFQIKTNRLPNPMLLTVVGKIFILGALLFAAASSALAADVLLAPSTGSYSVGQSFTSVVRVAPAGANVNAVEASLKFDPKVVTVVGVSKDGSAFSLWTTEPAFSNT